MRSWLWVMCCGILLTSCSSREALTVRQFTLKDTDLDFNDNALIRAERLKRLYGAVSRAEREDRKGQYYSVRWFASPTGGEVLLEFDYRQAGTGSVIKRLSHRLAPAAEGAAEFSVAGESYRVGGRVLAWRLRLSQDGALLSEKQSYLWE